MVHEDDDIRKQFSLYDDYYINLLTALQCRIINKFLVCVLVLACLHSSFFIIISTHLALTVAWLFTTAYTHFDLIFIFILLLSTVVTCYLLLTIMNFFFLSLSLHFSYFLCLLFFRCSVWHLVSNFRNCLYYLIDWFFDIFFTGWAI